MHLERGQPMDIRATEMRYLQKSSRQVQMTRPEFRRAHQTADRRYRHRFSSTRSSKPKSGTLLEGNVRGRILVEGDAREAAYHRVLRASLNLTCNLDDKQQATSAVATGNRAHGLTRLYRDARKVSAERLDMDLTGPKSSA